MISARVREFIQTMLQSIGISGPSDLPSPMSFEHVDEGGNVRTYTVEPGGRITTPHLSPNDQGASPLEATRVLPIERRQGRLHQNFLDSITADIRSYHTDPSAAQFTTRRQLDPAEFRWAITIDLFEAMRARMGLFRANLDAPIHNTSSYGMPMPDTVTRIILESLVHDQLISPRNLHSIANLPGFRIESYRYRSEHDYTYRLSIRATDGEVLRDLLNDPHHRRIGIDPGRPGGDRTVIMPRSIDGVYTNSISRPARNWPIQATASQQIQAEIYAALAGLGVTESTQYQSLQKEEVSVPLPEPVLDANSPRRLNLNRNRSNQDVPHRRDKGDQDPVDPGFAPRRKRVKRNGR